MNFTKQFFLSLGLLLPFCMFGQYLDSTSTWFYVRYTPNPFGNYTDFRTIIIDGDTTIQGHTYHKRYRSEKHFFEAYPSGVVTTSSTAKTFFDVVRDDGTAFYTNILGQDTMTLDFTKVLGDSITDWANICTASIDSIETIYLGVTPLKKWHIGDASTTLIYPYIEGIGSVHGSGLFHHCLFFGSPDYGLVCYRKQNDEYIDDTRYDCLTKNSIVKTGHFVEEGIEVFPNPSSGILTIQVKKYWEGHLQVFDIQGQLLLEKEVVGNNFQIDLTPYTAGVYFLRMTAANQTLTSYRKIIRL